MWLHAVRPTATVFVGENFGRLFKYASNTLCPERIRRGANEHVNASAFVFERAPGPKIFEIVFFVELSLLLLGPKAFTVLSTEVSHIFRVASLGKNNPRWFLLSKLRWYFGYWKGFNE